VQKTTKTPRFSSGVKRQLLLPVGELVQLKDGPPDGAVVARGHLDPRPVGVVDIGLTESN
jgi:hypothetical protein